MAQDKRDGPELRLAGSTWAGRLLRLVGWRIEFDGLPARQGVIAVYPHTSNWDFPIGLLTKWAVGLPARFWVKDSLFRLPLIGAFMRRVGGIAVDRSAANGLVGSTVQQMESARRRGEWFWLAVAPEGTRRAVPGWKSGFYRVALGADVPLCVASIDYGRRVVRVADFLSLSGDEAQDMARVAACLDGVRGLHPDAAAPIRLIR
ncbi:MAG: 1-acyl-sn-glycerol-3-phosphate acyltransferase [Burkholderiaceae bacterium]|nr:1-acyl-sn-glycerol-3-phosphate acyltransferase [Burkholderiaceae bacterium]